MSDTAPIVRSLAVPLLLCAPLLAGSWGLRGLVEQAPLSALALVATRAVLFRGVVWARCRGRLTDRALVVGAGLVGTEIVRLLHAHPSFGPKPIGFLDRSSDQRLPAPLLGDVSDIDRVLRTEDVQSVIVAFSWTREADLVGVLRTAVLHGVDLYVVPRFFDLGVDDAFRRVEDLWGMPLCRVRPAALRATTWPAKRALDVAVAAIGLVLTAPLLAVIALAVRLSSPGPILFRQARIGQQGRRFELLKFRSMQVNNDAETQWSVVGDRRLTSVGRLLPHTSLDELPQLWNILRGDMSLVGPRPERPHFVDQFSAGISGYTDRHRVPAGVTGWAQIHGLRGDSSIAERARFDNHYIEHWSLRRDVLILARTVKAMLRGSA